MKLLIVTQVVNTEHPILGFFHRWVEEFAKHCEHVHVICLEAGKHSLPANVTVHSLGKETGAGRITYLIRFYKYIWQLRKEYDNVFVHMNQIYVILGAPFWKTRRKRISLWYMHGSVSVSLRVAEKLANRIFTGSPESFRLKSEKVTVTGHGIDTARFAPQAAPKDLDLITVGRITESKNLTALIDILAGVRKSHNVTLTIVGSAVTKEEKQYERELQMYIDAKGVKENVVMVGRVEHGDLPQFLSRAKVFVTAAQNGSLDKAILEAMACGVPVVSMAPGTKSLLLGDNQVESESEFVTQVSNILNGKEFSLPKNTEYVKREHSLELLVTKLVQLLL